MLRFAAVVSKFQTLLRTAEFSFSNALLVTVFVFVTIFKVLFGILMTSRPRCS
jgi:hypothetical protein